jgi:hypothetical protein
MIALIGTREDTHIYRIRDALREAEIPAIPVGVEFGFEDIIGRMPFVCIAESAAIFAQSLRRDVPPEKIMDIPESFSDDEIVSTVQRQFFLRFGSDMETVHERGIRFDGRRVFFRAAELRLTKNEYMIVRLLFHGGGAYFSAEEIAAACLPDGVGGVAVHICNINVKAKRAHGVPLIETKRYKGYRIK